MFEHETDTDGDPLSAWIDAADYAPLKASTEQEVAVSLRRLLAAEAANYPDIDVERLERAGLALNRAGQWTGPSVAVDWLKEQPGKPRLAVILCMLVVSWNRGSGTPPPDPMLIEELISVQKTLSGDMIIENSLLVVLMVAARSGLPQPLSSRIRGMVELARETPGRHPEVRAILDSFLNPSSTTGGE